MPGWFGCIAVLLVAAMTTGAVAQSDTQNPTTSPDSSSQIVIRAPKDNSVAYLDAMRLVLETAPNTTIAAARARTVANDVLRARGRHLPTLNVNSGLGGSSVNTGVTASVNLWAAGGIEAQIKQQTALFSSSKDALRQICAETLTQASDAYVGVLRADALLAQNLEHLAEYDSILSMVQQIAAVDTGRRVDVEQVLTRKGLVQLQLLESQTLARQVRLTLARLTNRPIEPVEASVTPIAQALLPVTLADAIGQVERASPALASSKHDIEGAQHGVDVARAARWPQLNLVGTSTRDRANSVVRDRDNRVSLQTQWNLFNGGSDFYAERSSLQVVEAAKAREEDIRRTLALDISQTWEAINAAKARQTQQAGQARPARAVLDANRELFRLGRRTVLDILNAANDVHAVRISAIDARYESDLRSLRLHVSTGQLLPQVNLPASSTCGVESVVIPPSIMDQLGPMK
jgi:outer membrane protein TolC